MVLWRAPRPLVLASKSAVRRLVLEGAGIPLDCVPADIDERGLEARAGGRSRGEVAELLAREKARVVSTSLPGRLVLGADQTLALGDRSFSKPIDRTAARAQLMVLRGQAHELHSAISLQRDGAVLFEHRAVARLLMRPFSDDFLDAYLHAIGDAVLASVGCYQVEGIGIQLFERIEGDHFTIMGLPLLPLLDFLRRDGALAA
jgi:nucleoside triphosphate pyrophosphatase